MWLAAVFAGHQWSLEMETVTGGAALWVVPLAIQHGGERPMNRKY